MAESGSFLARIAHGSRVFGIGLMGFGAICVATPAIAGAPVVIVVGVILALAGGLRAIVGWRAWSAGKGPLGLVIGGLAMAYGLVLVMNPVSTLDTVSSLVAAYFVLSGLVELVFSGRLRNEDGRAWMWGDALFSIALGASMWVGWPLSGLHALGVLVGLKLLSAGAVLLRVERGLTRADAGLTVVRSRFDR